MSYLLLIMERVDARRGRTLEEGQEAYARMLRFTEELEARGLRKASDSLRTAGVRVEVRDGKRSVVDGPFAETKEIVAGFFFLDCKTREEAIAIASECPAAEWSTVEVREIGPCWEQ
jgi:hypothetical protein